MARVTKEIMETAVCALPDAVLMGILRDLTGWGSDAPFDWEISEMSEMIEEAWAGTDLVSFYDIAMRSPCFDIHDEYYGIRDVGKIHAEMYSACCVVEVLSDMDVLDELLEYLIGCYEEFPTLKESVEKTVADFEEEEE